VALAAGIRRVTFLPGILIALFIVIVAGVVAYVGDRVGHQVGRRRLTLFGLRPKYTSTIVAVGTGMLIALSVTVVALIASESVRTAFFRLGEINARIHALQAQAATQERELNTTRNRRLVLSKFAPIYVNFVVFNKDQPAAVQLKTFSDFFDETVRAANARFAKPPYALIPNKKKSSDPEVRKLLVQQLADVADRDRIDPVLLLPVADRNIFRGDQLSFSFEAYADIRLARAGEVLASTDVAGGTPFNYADLVAAARQVMAVRGVPPVFLELPLINQTQLTALIQQLSHARGKYRVVAKAVDDVYPHTTSLRLDFGFSSTH